jgi:hypothetical protein
MPAWENDAAPAVAAAITAAIVDVGVLSQLASDGSFEESGD